VKLARGQTSGRQRERTPPRLLPPRSDTGFRSRTATDSPQVALVGIPRPDL